MAQVYNPSATPAINYGCVGGNCDRAYWNRARAAHTPNYLRAEYQLDWNQLRKEGFSDDQLDFLKKHKAWGAKDSDKIYVSDFSKPVPVHVPVTTPAGNDGFGRGGGRKYTAHGYGYEHRFMFSRKSGAKNYKSPYEALGKYSPEDWGIGDPELMKWLKGEFGDKDVAWYKKHWNEGVSVNKVTGEISFTPKKYRGYWMRSTESAGSYTLGERVMLGMDLHRRLGNRKYSEYGQKYGAGKASARWRDPWWIEGDAARKEWRAKNLPRITKEQATRYSREGSQTMLHSVGGRWKSKTPYRTAGLPWSRVARDRDKIDIDYGFYEGQDRYKEAMEALGMKSFSLPKHLLTAENYMYRLSQNPQYKSPYQMKIEDLYDKLNNLKVTTGQVTGLDTKIEDISKGLLDEFSGGTDFDQSMRENLQALGVTLEGDSVKSIGGLDINQVLGDISTHKGELTDLTGKFSGLEDDLARVQTQGKQGLEALEASLMADYGGKLTDLDKTFASKLKKTEDALGGDLATIQSGFEAQKLATEGKFGDLETKFEQDLTGLGSDFKDKLAASESRTAADLLGTKQQLQSGLSDVYQSREKAIGNLQEDWAGKLQKQETALQGEIDTASQAFNDRLTKLSSTMNYRMLGDSAGGVRMRRSKAHKSGASARGTGQLGRSSMRIQSLNI